MSRSYKKHPVAKDSPRSSHFNKRLASRITRRKLNRGEELYSHKGYRRIVSPWLIHDYVVRWTEKDAREMYRASVNYSIMYNYDDPILKRYPTEDEYIEKVWKKYKRK